MSDTVTIDFEKIDGTTGSLTFEDVDDVNEVGMSGGGSQIIAYRDGGTNGTIDHVEDYEENWS
jgi:hypothetical protein